jgi:glycosyltransferase involved in cell wall biosynthesis
VTRDLVSTIIPVFNRAAMLREAVASVLAQTWRPIEIIIVDDGSTDDTLSVAKELASSQHDIVQVLSQPNGGPGIARQAGLEIAQGEFIQFLDSDDLLLPTKFSLQITGLRDDQEAGISYGLTYTSKHGIRASVPAQRTAETHRNIFPALLAGRIWETCTPLYRRSTLDQIGPWPAKRQMEDWEFDAKAGAAHTRLNYCETPLATYRIHSAPRLAHAWMTNPQAMHDRITAHIEILRYAVRAEVASDSPEMRRYARTLFWIARHAGAHGYTKEAAQLLDLVQAIANQNSSRAFDVVLYRQLAKAVGWKMAGWFGGFSEALRSSERR